MNFIKSIPENKVRIFRAYCQEYLGSELEACLDMICQQFLDKCQEQIDQINQIVRDLESQDHN